MTSRKPSSQWADDYGKVDGNPENHLSQLVTNHCFDYIKTLKTTSLRGHFHFLPTSKTACSSDIKKIHLKNHACRKYFRLVPNRRPAFYRYLHDTSSSSRPVGNKVSSTETHIRLERVNVWSQHTYAAELSGAENVFHTKTLDRYEVSNTVRSFHNSIWQIFVAQLKIRIGPDTVIV